jgi:hypothetical protein
MKPATNPSPPAKGFWKTFLALMSRKEKVGFSLSALLLLGIFIIMPAGDLAIQEWDKNSPTEWRECTVTKAEPYHAYSNRPHSRRYESYQVKIDTNDCGNFELDKGVSEDNYKDRAREITPGEYRLELAASAVKMESFERFFHTRIDLESIEPVGANGG